MQTITDDCRRLQTIADEFRPTDLSFRQLSFPVEVLKALVVCQNCEPRNHM
jgi:hypothetical protein